MNHYEKTQKLNDVDFKQIIGVKRQLLRDDGGFDRGVSKEARKNLAAHRERRICGMPRTVENAAMTCADVRVSDATRAAEPRV
ncbi:MAG: hypothetical protein LBD85_03605, partial [Oscillospiraceae bacterium]|nr:hypothetical protein [Oscillospiraceae bacterium]